MKPRPRILIALVAGLVFGALTWDISAISLLSANPAVAWIQELLSYLLMPGIVVAAAVAGNIHAWSLWLAAVGNFVFYFGLTWLAARLLFRRRKAKSFVQTST
jgi:hypothetical protein